MSIARVVHLSLPTLHALAAGDLDQAVRSSGLRLTAYVVDAEQRALWAIRRDQVAADPSYAGWVTGAVYDDERALTVGCAGFHGPPDDRGMVEVGYRIDPDHRRRGYARAAVTDLLDRARREETVGVVRASVNPDNVASQRLVCEFAPVGEQWDDEDGLEVVYELAVP